VAGEDLLSAIELLEQHAADKQMRPSHRAERQDRFGAAQYRCIQTIRSADSESEFGHTPIAPSGNAIGQSAARPRRAALVERYERSAGGQGAKQQFPFPSL
jgi:hypothetical protein